MESNFKVWFSNYDARRCKLFRAALTLKNEPWSYTDYQAEAGWWVIDDTDSYDVEAVIEAYKQQIKHVSPVIIILKESGDNEYYDSWASLRVPMNFITFFKWMDGVIDRGIREIKREQETHVEILQRFQGSLPNLEFLAKASSYEPSSELADEELAKSLAAMPALTADLLESSSIVIESPDAILKAVEDDQFTKRREASHRNDQRTSKQLNGNEHWKTYPFRLTTWPNVARYGTDYRLVLFCSKMLRGFVTLERLMSLNSDKELIEQLLQDADVDGLLYYDRVSMEAVAQKKLAQHESSQQIYQNEVLDEKPAKVASVNQINHDKPVLVAAEADMLLHDDVLSGQQNKRSFGLFETITKFFKR